MFIACIHFRLIQCDHSLNNFGLCVVGLFKTILLQEHSFDLQSGIVYTGIFYSFCLATRDEFEDSWLSTACQ